MAHLVAHQVIQRATLLVDLAGDLAGSPSGSTERLAPCPPSAVFTHVLTGDFCTQPPPFTYAIRSVLPDGLGGSRCREWNAGSGVQSAETESDVQHAASIILLINL